MGFKHLKRVWELPLPSTERFVLMALADHANDIEECWPSNERIGERTGFCTKTVGRALCALKKLGLITVNNSKKYNSYRLHINGELQYLVGYLKYHIYENKSQAHEHQSTAKDSESNKTYNTIESSKNIYLKNEIEEKPKIIFSVKPIDVKAPFQDIWINTMKIKYKGFDCEFTDIDKWNLNEINVKLKNYPGDIVISEVVTCWKDFVTESLDAYPKMKYLKLKTDMPSTEFLLNNIEKAKPFAMTMYEMMNFVPTSK